MNNILFVARKAKSYKEGQIARKLEIEESLYIEIENNIQKLPSAFVDRLEKLYNLPKKYFWLFDSINVNDRLGELEKQRKELLDSEYYKTHSSNDHVAIAFIGIHMKSQHEHLRGCFNMQFELMNKNIALRKLYEQSTR